MKGVAVEAGEVSKGAVSRKGMKRGFFILDFVLRIIVGVATLSSAVAMGTTQERLSFSTQFVQFTAEFDDLPSFVFELTLYLSAMMSLLAAAAIVYIAHKGNPNANWFAICQQYNSFCERISGSLIGSFIAVAVFIILIIRSAVSISRP